MKMSKKFKREVKQKVLLFSLIIVAIISGCFAMAKFNGKIENFDVSKIFVGETGSVDQTSETNFISNDSDSEKSSTALMSSSESNFSVNSTSEYDINNAQIASGNLFELALKPDGTVWSWGNNSYGQLGNGNIANEKISQPNQVLGVNGEGKLSNIKQISVGESFAIALTDDGKVLAWGQNTYGQLGNNTTDSSGVPVYVQDENGKDIENIKQISAGSFHGLAVSNDGTVYSWGLNSYGQLGLNVGNTTASNADYKRVVAQKVKQKNVVTSEDGTESTEIGELDNIKQVSGGHDFSVALTNDGEVYEGTVLEHMLMQHLTSFYDVGEHNHIRLRGADWNDGLDMADERGESVAFTALYGGNLGNMAKLIKSYADMTGNETVELAKEMLLLLNVDPTVYDSIDEKHEVLYSYCEQVKHSVSGEKVNVKCTELCTILNRMSQWIAEHIRNTEWIKSKDGYSWFNGYYDNHGNAVDGDFESGVRMMITAQVFTIMAGTATKEQIKDITAAADKYLYDEKVGGYRLNTDFKEVKTDLGRLFGFAYGHKENGAVFCHMATMYANALYQRGFAKEGYQVINTLFKHCNDYKVSGIYPGVPEYISQRGRGMYHYLTGAASWMLLTVLNEMYGVKGEIGALKFKPKLLAKQFENGEASVSCMFRGTNIHVTYKNGMCKDAGDYKVAVIYIDGQRYGETDTIAKEDVDKFGDKADIVVVLQ